MAGLETVDFRVEVAAGLNEPLAQAGAEHLRAELAELPGLSASFAEALPGPAGSKSAGFGLMETIVAVSAAGAAIPTLITAVRDWIVRQPPVTTVKIRKGDFEFEWSGATLPSNISEIMSRLSSE